MAPLMDGRLDRIAVALVQAEPTINIPVSRPAMSTVPCELNLLRLSCLRQPSSRPVASDTPTHHQLLRHHRSRVSMRYSAPASIQFGSRSRRDTVSPGRSLFVDTPLYELGGTPGSAVSPILQPPRRCFLASSDVHTISSHLHRLELEAHAHTIMDPLLLPSCPPPCSPPLT